MFGRGTEVGGARVAGRGCCWPDARGNNCEFAVMRAAAALAGGHPCVSLAAPVLSAAVPEPAGAASAMLPPPLSNFRYFERPRRGCVGAGCSPR